MKDSESKVQETVPIPGPPPLPVVGNLFEFTEDGLGSMMKLVEKYGPIYQLWLGGEKTIVVSSRDLCDELCDESRFCKLVAGALENLRDGVGDGLFTAHEGEENWAIAHRITMPIFGPIKIRNMFGEMKSVLDELCLKWTRYGPEHKFDAVEDFTRLTLDTIALCAMDYRFNSFYRDGQHPFVNSMVRFLKEADTKAALPSFVNSLRRQSAKGYNHDIGIMKGISQEIVDKRRANPVDTPDLLNALILGQDPKTGKRLTDEAITNNMITFLIAGHETTSGLLSFLLYFLLATPGAFKKAQQEVDTVVEGADITVDHLSKLPYITAAMRETLRLMPTAPGFTVTAREDTNIGSNYFVKKGEALSLLLPAIHRDKTFWGPDADDWKAERMLDQEFQKLPPNGWKPFGNGSRACIGRAFAWQEAQLVIAVLLSKFDIEPADPTYKLKIKETLTIKPDDFQVKATLRRRSRHNDPSHSLSPSASTALSSKRTSSAHFGNQTPTSSINGTHKPITILFGSNTGTCEALANSLLSHAVSHGFTAQSVNMMDSATDDLPKNQPVVIITASYDGTPADNAARFVSFLQSSKPKQFEQVFYAVFGCGHRDWNLTFHKIPILVDSFLENAGAERIIALGKADAAISDMFSDFESWEESLWSELVKRFNPSFKRDKTGPAFDIHVTISQPRAPILGQRLIDGVITETKTLTHGGPLKKHIEIRLPEGAIYETGDYLTILPLNPRRNVQRTLAAFGLARDSMLDIMSTTSSNSLPTNTPTSASDVFESYVELAQPATPGNIKVLAAAAEDETVKNQLLHLAGPGFSTEIRDKKVSILDLLERFNDVRLPIASFLAMLPPLRIRTYSIASSPGWHPSHASLTVSVIDQPSKSGQGRFLGVASNYIAELAEGDIVRVQTRFSKASFRPPTDPDAFPIIMIAAGSGLAPFMGFLQERAIQSRNGMRLKPAKLFFGCRSPEKDDIYRSDLDNLESQGIVDVCRAYSCGQVYVQDRVKEQGTEVHDLWNQGAKVFLCGSSRMIEGVKSALSSIFGGELDPERFVVDVFA